MVKSYDHTDEHARKERVVPTRTRKLIDGMQVPSHDHIETLTINTHCPAKWLFVDVETGEVWYRDGNAFKRARAGDVCRLLQAAAKYVAAEVMK